MTEENIKNAFDFCNRLAENEQNNYRDLFVFINKFRQIYDKEKQKLPYHINLIDELHANENAHSRILEKLLKQKTHEGKYELLENFIEYLKEKGKDKEDFVKIKIEQPKITQEKERIDLWIRDKSYAIVIENKVKWAGDQQAQIERYIDITKEDGFKDEQIFVIYLPPTHEKEPEKQSWGKYFEKEIYNQRYLVLSFRDDIILWLKEKVLPNIRIKDVYLRSAIEQYIDHLEGIFSLRTINNKMNMELQKFIESELKLSEQEPIKALQTISEKEKALNDADVQLQIAKEKFRKLCLIKWYNQLKQDFPNHEVIKNFDHKDCPNIAVKLQYKGTDFAVLIEYRKNYKGAATPYYGIGRHFASKQKEEIITDFVRTFLVDGFNFNSPDWWYGWKDTSFQNGYMRLKNLIKSVLQELPQKQ